MPPRRLKRYHSWRADAERVVAAICLAALLLAGCGSDAKKRGKEVDAFLRQADISERTMIAKYVDNGGGLGIKLKPLTPAGRREVAGDLCGYLDAKQWDWDIYILDERGSELALC